MAEKPEDNSTFKNTCKNFFKKAIQEIKDVFTLQDYDISTITDPNVAFYSNEIPFFPNGEKIEHILKSWSGNYDVLENNHNYIQWLFPNRNPGQNSSAAVLTNEEAQIIRSTPELKERVKRSFEMMLDFYGMKLTEDNKFELAENSMQRLHKLNRRNNHNYLRITRILLAIKELGYSQLMLPWMKFLADLIYKQNLLGCAALNFEKFWLDTLDAEDHIDLKIYLAQLKSTRPTDTTINIPFTTNPAISYNSTQDTLPGTNIKPVKELSITHH